MIENICETQTKCHHRRSSLTHFSPKRCWKSAEQADDVQERKHTQVWYANHHR